MPRITLAKSASLLVLVLLVGSNLILPAGAHVTRRMSHLVSHLDPRYINVEEKASDANLLDGQDSSAFLRANAKAADADLLDGQNSTAFMAGPGTVIDGAALLDPLTFNTVIIEPGFFKVEYLCPDPASNDTNVRFSNISSATAFDVFADNESANPTFHGLSSSGSFLTEASAVGDHITYLVRSPTLGFATIHVMSLHGPTVCIAQAHAVISS
jgi:hypothetical protein